MESLKQWLDNHCICNAEFLSGPIKAVVVNFHGLNSTYRNSASDLEITLAENNILVLSPYYGPWGWMNRLSRQLVDEVVEKAYKYFNLSENIPLIANGASMGGLAAFLYTRYGKKTPIGCCTLFPVCDLAYHYNERPDVPISVTYAFYGYKESFEDILIEHSPIEQAEKLPNIPYFVIHGDFDKQVDKSHSDRMVEKLRNLGKSVQYMEVAKMGHGGINMPLSVKENMVKFIVDLANK
jgi:dipeptidyl aminopeptidase/acylaminoacyl peptidase